MADNYFDPAATLGPNDPLREWAAQNLDWRTGKLLQQDPKKAIDDLIKRGVPPPDAHAPLNYTADEAYANSPTEVQLPQDSATKDLNPIVRTNRDGTIASNITTPSEASPAPPGGASATPRMDPNTAPPSSSLPSASSSNDEPSTLPPGRTAEDQAQDDAQDIADANAKVPSAGDALADFGKSLSGVKAPPLPPLNAVGTPSVRSPTSAGAANLTQLMSLLQGGAVPQTAPPGLGRLLVAGKI